MLCLALAGCALNAEITADTTASTGPTIDDHCATPPTAASGSFAHTSTAIAARFGGPRHRGIDVIAAETDNEQHLAGKLAYSAADKDAKDERVVLFACIDGDWKSLGDTRTDRGGRFTVTLSGNRRLPPGTRDLYGFVPADRSGFPFLAYVAKTGESAIVVDVDGTLTASENAIFNTVLFGDDIGHRAGAPEALAGSGHPVIYLSSRGDQLTGVTRAWLRRHGFPPGPIRHAKKSITKPGPKTVRFKADVLREIERSMPIHAAIGNKATDIAAYREAGIAGDRIFIKLPEFESEVAADLAARRAVGFADYASIAPRLR